MSAYIVDKRTIDGLITSIEGDHYLPAPLDTLSAEDLGRVLWGENLASIEYRYPDTVKRGTYPGPIGITREEITGYQFERLDTPLTAVEVLRVLSTYNYQSCESPSWYAVDTGPYHEITNPARILHDTIKSRAINKLPGYADAMHEVPQDRPAGNVISIMSMIGK